MERVDKQYLSWTDKGQLWRVLEEDPEDKTAQHCQIQPKLFETQTGPVDGSLETRRIQVKTKGSALIVQEWRIVKIHITDEIILRVLRLPVTVHQNSP